jgi:1,4-dihydroxy-2-naphthoate octaprenyltransferase
VAQQVKGRFISRCASKGAEQWRLLQEPHALSAAVAPVICGASSAGCQMHPTRGVLWPVAAALV